METKENSNDLRVASFSYYLKPHEHILNVSDMALFDLHQIKPSIFTARTPSIASEASSWTNSQSSLLQQTNSQAKAAPSGGAAFGRRLFHACTAPCLTGKSVCITESIKQHDHFAFPVLNPASEEKTEDILPRMSLEVFGSSRTLNKGDIAKNLVRKMSILTWDAIPKSKESVICDDMASEASSDLFEIENISKSAWQPSESSCAMSPSTQYAPSEASIEWSVMTASAAEFSSVYSGYDEKHHGTSNNGTSVKNKIEVTKKGQKVRSNGLLGCKSHKSVKVAEPVVYRTMEKSKY